MSEEQKPLAPATAEPKPVPAQKRERKALQVRSGGTKEVK